jgi:hypothetical protein
MIVSKQQAKDLWISPTINLKAIIMANEIKKMSILDKLNLLLKSL